MTNLRAPEDTTLRVRGLPTSDNRWEVLCLNCEAQLHGPFCSRCGQRAIPPHPTVRQLAGDAFAELTGWDGKFAETIRILLRRPGELTRQWIEGRRAHFISPLRLYLTASLLYFVVAAAAPNLGRSSATRINVGGVDVVGGRNTPSRPERVAEAASQALTTATPLTPAQRDSALADIASAPALMRPMLRKSVDDPSAINAGMLRWMPRMLFALLPIYALLLMIVYRRRHYPEHLFFAVHLHAFVFIALTVAEAPKFTGIFSIARVGSIAALLWIATYSLLALRRVYGGGLAITLLKSAIIMALYCVVALPMMVAAVFLAAF